MRKSSLLAAAGALGCVLAVKPALAETVEIDPSGDLIGAVASLSPGDELVLAGGTYNLTERFAIDVSGTEAAPIVIRAKEGEVAIITRPDAGQNTINIENVEYVELRGIEVMGGSHGIRIDHSSHVTIEGCHIHDTADVGISANVGGSVYEGLRLIRNHIHDTGGTGEGMYLGCNENACQMLDSIVAQNYIHHTNGADVSQGDGIEVKEGSAGNVIADNVIHDTNYPCIITYSTVGNGPPNSIERNAMWACGDHGIQSAADVVIRNNIILGANADAIRNQPHQSGAPGNIVIANNTILKPSGDGIRADGIVGSITISNNAIYTQSGNAIRLSGDLASVNLTANLGIGGVENVPDGGFLATGDLANDFVAASFSGAPPNDVYPREGSALIGSGNQWQLAEDDFNGTPRGGQMDVGAYKFDAAGNPGWTIGAGFKDAPPPHEEGGSSGDGGSSAGGSAGDGGAPASGGGTSAGGAPPEGGDSSDDGCRVGAGGSGGSFAALLAFVALTVRARRNRKDAR
ncbi:MAG: hypothetical protein HOW73_44705 [Polyangiaceae bacterium]|nr:hypothetical protein [Polyangiaceae bacterium]